MKRHASQNLKRLLLLLHHLLKINIKKRIRNQMPATTFSILISISTATILTQRFHQVLSTINFLPTHQIFQNYKDVMNWTNLALFALGAGSVIYYYNSYQEQYITVTWKEFVTKYLTTGLVWLNLTKFDEQFFKLNL